MAITQLARNNYRQYIWRVMLALVLLLFPLFNLKGNARAQDSDPYLEEAQQIMQQMSVADRVGQLFLVTFEGDATELDSDILDLIVRYNIGGVILLAENDNIIGVGDEVPMAVADLSNRLQQLALLGPENIASTSDETTPTPTVAAENTTPLPLFIATQQEGDGAPNSQIRYGLTQLPGAMAIGAGWQTDFAEATGRILGRELSTIGVNMLLGPSLDVLENPNPDNSSDLGTRAFGGDPYWVGLMGSAYTRGLHEGSDGAVAVVARNFPGRGSSDRPLDEEVSTVRKSLEQLKQVELAPFFLVTGQAPDAQAAADALLVTHIRYQGFQGNLRDTTAPVSFDPPALQTLMSLPELSNWRSNGGIMVSDSLGVRAVQRFYDNSGQEFPHRQVAKDALLAGNDLLYIDQFALDTASIDDQMANLRDTITWFQDRYLTDPAFQQRVDDAATRIIRLKLKLYGGDFSPENVLVDLDNISENVRQTQAPILSLAQEAITLIAPGQNELQERLPRPPGPEDEIVIFTDVRQWQQCSTCPQESYIGQESLEERILALYGPNGSNQVNPNQILSFSFADLEDFLAAGPGTIPPPTSEPATATVTTTVESGPTPTVEFSPEFQVQSALQNAEWVIFATLDISPSNPQSTALKRLLSQRPDVIRNARTIVFGYRAPYYLDTTEISKLTAYYAVYSNIDAFIDTSVRTLFQEHSTRGASPVDITAIDYHLFEITQPAANQVIDLFVVRSGSPESPPSEEPLELLVGDTLRLRTGVIVDQNGHPVPDGTPVQFVQQDRLQGFVSVIGERPTTNGIAEIDYVLEARTGQFRITANAGMATSSQQLDVAIGENVRVVVVTLTPAPTVTVTGTATPTQTPRPTNTPTPTTTPTPVPEEETSLPPAGGLIDGGMTMLGVLGGLLLTNLLGIAMVRSSGGWNRTRLVRITLWGLVAGLIAYNYYALDLPGANLIAQLESWAAVATTTVGGLLGLFVGWQFSRPDHASSTHPGATGD